MFLSVLKLKMTKLFVNFHIERDNHFARVTLWCCAGSLLIYADVDCGIEWGYASVVAKLTHVLQGESLGLSKSQCILLRTKYCSLGLSSALRSTFTRSMVPHRPFHSFLLWHASANSFLTYSIFAVLLYNRGWRITCIWKHRSDRESPYISIVIKLYVDFMQCSRNFLDWSVCRNVAACLLLLTSVFKNSADKDDVGTTLATGFKSASAKSWTVK